MKDQFCTIYLVRHGESTANAQGLGSGVTDDHLTELGMQQAKLLGEKLKDIHFDAAYSSDLVRAKRTAELVLLERQLAVQTRELLRERNFGDFEGRPREEYVKVVQDTLAKMEAVTDEERIRMRFSAAEETEEEVTERLMRILREISASHLGQTVLIGNHGGTMRMLLTKLGFGRRKELVGTVRNTAYIKLLCDGVDFVIEEVHDIVKKKLDE